MSGMAAAMFAQASDCLDELVDALVEGMEELGRVPELTAEGVAEMVREMDDPRLEAVWRDIVPWMFAIAQFRLAAAKANLS